MNEIRLRFNTRYRHYAIIRFWKVEPKTYNIWVWEIAGYGWRDYKSTSWGKRLGLILQTELKSGTKRSILVYDKGLPLGISVDGANIHDMKMTKATLQSIAIYRPEPTIRLKRAHVP